MTETAPGTRTRSFVRRSRQRADGTARRLVLPVCVVLVTSAAGGHAADHGAAVTAGSGRTLVLVDEHGDANGFNGQGLVGGVSHVSPLQVAGADLLEVRYTSTWQTTRTKRQDAARCTGFTARVTLAAPPAADTWFRLIGTGVRNDGQWWLQYDGTRSTVRYSTLQEAWDDAVRLRDLANPVQVVGRTLTFTVTEADIRATRERLSTFAIHEASAHTRARVLTPVGRQLTPLAWDETDTYAGAFRPC